MGKIRATRTKPACGMWCCRGQKVGECSWGSSVCDTCSIAGMCVAVQAYVAGHPLEADGASHLYDGVVYR